MAGSTDKDGRKRVVLRKDKRSFGVHVARAVLEAFKGPAPPGMECRHINGDASESGVSNLAWGTHAENMEDKKAHGTFCPPPVLRGENNPKATLTYDDVRCIRAEPDFRGVTMMLGRAFGIRPESVANIRRGLTWKHVIM